MKPESKASLLERCKMLETESTTARLALHDLLNGDVKWFGNSRAFSIGVTRPQSACGGIAIVRFSGNSATHYLESYATTELAHIAMCVTGENTEHNRELLQRRAAIESAVAYQREAIRAA